VSISDTNLWEDFKRGDESAFASIFCSHYKAMLNYGLKFHKDAELVEDSIQELFLELWKNRSSLGTTNHIKPYLLTSVRRKIIKILEKGNKIKKLFSKDISQEYDFEVVFSYESTLIQSQTDEEQVKKIQAILSELPPRQKEILYLLFYQDMSYEEISQIMELSYQSARNLVHRAVKLLREKATHLDR
jgi:RNA polymerase sigma factor (sigma-70 family)